MPSGFRVLRSAACAADIDRIFDHLFQAYQDLGDTPQSAFERAVDRVRSVDDAMETLGAGPFQGTLVPHIMPGLRHVTKDGAIFYFMVDETAQQVRVLAVFFGGQDHRQHMLGRILAG
ncbi:MAG: type II toxin-antitoxin system RelE/ParE family toxin [Ruegeria sp.]